MNWLDQCTRSALSSWHKIPKDTTTAYFHAEVMDSGLGVPLLSQTMPLMRSKRLGRLGLSEDPVILAMVEYLATRPALQKHLQASSSRTCIINTSGALHSALADQLHRSFNG